MVLAGPPASGKTTLAAAIATATGLSIVSKDVIKEAMMDHVGGAPEVGAAAFAVQFVLARELLTAGSGLILEGAFFREQREIVDLAALAHTVAIELHCDVDVLERRYIERAGLRHPAHRGLEALPDLRDRVARNIYGVPELRCPLLRVDTTNGYVPPAPEIIRFVTAD